MFNFIKMLYRTIDGKLIEINKYDFKNDKLYYEKILSIKTPSLAKSKKTFGYKNYKQTNK
jgi:hypothetical protein